MTEFEAIKQYEQKFCHVPNNKDDPNMIIFVVSVKRDYNNRRAVVCWCSPETPTIVLRWPADLENVKRTLKIIC